MNILLVGSGGREHALARALDLDPDCDAIFCVPGNPGTKELGTNLALDPNDAGLLTMIAQSHAIELVVIGPEAPLVDGLADAFRDIGIPVFGPSAAAAQLEGSKAFAKEVMEAANVPTAASYVCSDTQTINKALDEFAGDGIPWVVKDDGLAGGKGVVVTTSRQEAFDHARHCVEDLGHNVVIEEYLDGPEISLFCLSDGTTVVPLQGAQDFKRVNNGQTGPNTGGMGAYSPLPWAPDDLEEQVVRTIAQPTVDEMARRGTPFVGLLYCGLALTSKGLKVIEFNVRFGDPETQVVLPRLKTPLATLLYAAATGTLADQPPLEWMDEAAVCVIIANEGYPGTVVGKGREIRGVSGVKASNGAHVIHCGTTEDKGRLLATGGRVLCMVGMGPTVQDARKIAYSAVDCIELEGEHHRTDIAEGI